ncbi:MAG: LON peptidase substrate-binding domain-containing protein, partial [Planctomycetes bacterium]|nr:LON peptidase substrate-binding domain-containing protein [Planctomycetota bacterium]
MTHPLPIFPLPNVLLYPGAVLPLHIFEPRFVSMIDDMLAADSDEFLLTLLKGDWELSYFEANPEIYDIGGLARVLQCSKDDSGSFNLLVSGCERVRLTEVDSSDKEYRLANYKILTETPIQDPEVSEKLRLALRDGLVDFADGSLMLAPKAKVGYLSDVLTVAMSLDMAEKQKIFEILDQ